MSECVTCRPCPGAQRARTHTWLQRLRYALAEMPMSRAELVAALGEPARLVDRAIERALQLEQLVPIHVPGRAVRLYAVPGFVPPEFLPMGTPLSPDEREILEKLMRGEPVAVGVIE